MDNILDQFEDNDEIVKQWRWFIGPSSDFYVREWLQIRKGKLFSFNWYACLFGVFWLLYRKMHKPAVIVLSIYFAEGYLESLILKQYPINYSSWELIRIAFYFIILGFIGNWIYYYHAVQEINQIIENTPQNLHQQALTKRGGTSFLSIFILIFCILLIVLLNRTINFRL